MPDDNMPEPSEAAQTLADRFFCLPGYAFIDGRIAEEIDAFAVRTVETAVKSRDETIAALQEEINILNAARYEAVEAAVAKERARCATLVRLHITTSDSPHNLHLALTVEAIASGREAP